MNKKINQRNSLVYLSLIHRQNVHKSHVWHFYAQDGMIYFILQPTKWTTNQSFDIHLGMRKVFWKDWICNLDCFETYHVELLWRLLVNQLFLEIHAVFSEKLQSQLFLTDDRWHQFKRNFLNRYLSRYSPLVLLIKNRLVFKFPQFPIPILF